MLWRKQKCLGFASNEIVYISVSPRPAVAAICANIYILATFLFEIDLDLNKKVVLLFMDLCNGTIHEFQSLYEGIHGDG